jgi:hypothetical protein
MFGRFKALFLLAFGLVKTLLQRFGPARSLQVFQEHYGSENIVAVTTEEAKLLSRVIACTACGRCDAFEGQRVATSARGYRGMMAFVLAGTRSLPDYGRTSATIVDVPDEAFVQAEKECPEAVPLLSLAQLVRSHAARLS